MATRSPDVPRPYRAAVDRVPGAAFAGHHVADTSEVDEIVVFLIGMRVHRWRKVTTWLPIFLAMPRMQAELAKRPDAGLLHVENYWGGRVFYSVQYWRSAEHLGRFAKDPSLRHAPAWARFNRRGAGTGDVGLFHETYRVDADHIETRYLNMTPHGLSKALGVLNRSRARRTTTDELLDATPLDRRAE